MKKNRILLGLREIGEYNRNLKEGFQELGIRCTFIDLAYSPFQYTGSDTPNIIVSLKKWTNKKTLLTEKTCVKNSCFILSHILDFPLFIWALFRFDVFIFSFGESFLNYLDLPILKLFHKKIIFVFFGSDSRPPYIGLDLVKEKKDTIPKHIKRILNKKRRIQKIEKYADIIVNHPPTSHFHERKIIQWLIIGIPKKYTLHNNSITKNRNLEIKILHAPSNPAAKGTEIIRKSIKSLREKGYSINYTEITGKPHSIVISELQKCDFIVDQIYSDTPMATLATEAAWHGKPSVVGGYYIDHIYNDTPQETIPPSLYCHPDEIENSIEKMIVDEPFRKDLGKKAMEFVQKNWSPEKVAARYLRLIEGDIPESWYYDPYSIRYLHGAGVSESLIKDNMKAIIEYGGIESLQLSDKPELEKEFENFTY
ncbi:glycosyltransferase [Methanosarcina sp. T3]|uniref:glycosyltransferase n=1 Tax=Methanosarcina sp. T3 TaxID=3439062 RepID=UPI003F850FB3